jgi:hypothetical protein
LRLFGFLASVFLAIGFGLWLFAQLTRCLSLFGLWLCLLPFVCDLLASSQQVVAYGLWLLTRFFCFIACCIVAFVFGCWLALWLFGF